MTSTAAGTREIPPGIDHSLLDEMRASGVDVERIMAEKVRYKPSANGTEEFKLSRGTREARVWGSRWQSRRVATCSNRGEPEFGLLFLSNRILLGPNRD